jgi:hypothetical protein
MQRARELEIRRVARVKVRSALEQQKLQAPEAEDQQTNDGIDDRDGVNA